MKKAWAFAQGSETTPSQGATCGSIAGAISAAATCPLDVVKTRMMLGAKTKSGKQFAIFSRSKSGKHVDGTNDADEAEGGVSPVDGTGVMMTGTL